MASRLQAVKTNGIYGVAKSILTNEKYYGMALMGKTFKPDVLSKKRYKNEGQAEQYCMDNAFEGIISIRRHLIWFRLNCLEGKVTQNTRHRT